ncbi:interferon-induced very large GTPase 1-like [Bufo gargarizans]|uniref:interferon-induced very large GTPase 1-like n=1 Tax=Bufo gargarizans TaxID=30331 RepID=UPI001CF35A1D|nr:interferon-induced very large GTPase 1-like [Bufo gargarizans]XP_044158118.1 interferon-induced very large GTPase 1-like [Bufo gargarizans]XP_044158119.1 interferon-induced very large GTPase 1-like [Bufo gargarizans]XP_044158120.1 interferon-induced very large GTPase 1-like [Bufo gargarizans]XP_044158121.1 interferon-induced very large GTPase 1-like [Bufo gargarizans]XP_044158123.1 interferon-induced very large GTPase 1-like [Bufo gargarizans]XP_044158124.1 interferon-induced very large GT
MSGHHDGSSSDVELVNRLRETGLDPEYWLGVLEENLGINNIQSVQYIQPEDCSLLEEKTRYQWEKRALRQLCNVPDSSTNVKETQEKRRQVMKEKNEQALKAITELKTLRSEGKDRHDEMVKQREEEIRKALEIPSDCSAPHEKSIVDLIDYYKKQIKFMEEPFKKSDNIKDEDLLRYASGGLALEGIFQTKNINDVFQKREPLLCIPDCFQLLGPEQSPVFQQKEFTSQIEESSFKKTVEKVGLSLSSSVNFSFMGFGLKIGTDYSKDSESDKTSKQSSQQQYVCTTRYNYIPLASCYFTKDQMKLSQSALNALKDIEKLIAIDSGKQGIRMKCTDFFQRFGSHVNLGPVHFGGIYWWKASMEGISSNQMQEAKRMTSEALNFYVGASYAGIGGDFDLKKTNTYGSIDQSTISKFQKDIQFFSTKTGGPSEVDSLFHWRSGLIASNKTWSVIDRGFQLMPVWEIIVSNHRDQFTDTMKLASCLIDSYTSSTGLSSETMVGENLLTALEKTKIFLQEIQSWKAEDSEEHLKTLSDFKQTLNETTRSYSAWVNLCLSDKGLQEFLLSIVKRYQESTEKNVYRIKISLQELLEPHIYSVDNFLDASFIMRWIYNSEKNELDQIHLSEFKELLDVLQKSKENLSQITLSLSSSTEEQFQAKIKATQQIGCSLYSFLKTMRKTKQKDSELLVLLIANNAGYCIKNLYFRNILGRNDIDILQNNIEEVYKEYANLKGQCAERAQAFLLYTGFKFAGVYKEMTAQQKADRLNFMKSHLEGDILSNVNKIVHQRSEFYDWSKMEDNLREFAYGIVLRKEFSSDEIAKELENICQDEITLINTDEQIDSSNMDKDFLQLLKRLDLVKYYPQKMKTADFHKICRSSMSETLTLGEHQLSFHYLQKLLMLDYRARYTQYKSANDLTQKNIVTINDKVDENDISEDFLDYFLDDSNEEFENQSANQEQPIHPMDLQMAIFHCANDFMRQYIYTKLSLCQFAVPMLVKNPSTKLIEFPLWSFQEVKKKWKAKSVANNKCVTEAETPIVSFIRFGPSASSKSQIINWLISKQRHDIFYHRHCKGSTKNSLLMNGITEIAWYCPGGKDDDAFDDCIAFTNLHGDARDHDKQVQFLEQISSVIVVLFNDRDAREGHGKIVLQRLVRSPTPLICLIADKECPPPKPGTKLKIGLRDRNEADMVDIVATTIQSLLTSSNQRHSLNKCASIARSHGFIVDVDKEQCKQGRDHAEVLLSLLKEKKLSAIKESFLPLQGDLWHMWCTKDKELTRLKRKNNLSIEQQRSDIESQKQALRNSQIQKAFPLNDFMRSLLNILHSNAQGSKLYFLQWFKMFLDDLSSETLSTLYHEYHNVWSDLKVEKQKGKNKRVIQKIENNLEQLSTKINISTFGLEHILRELAQIYEALETFPEKDKSFFTLPKIAAHLMVSGYPLELMDGDAAHVPLKWIGAVLDELIGLLGDKKLYVLSVLGIQSTGKSTLLNAMFGLQFAVSAGRCTRGAFMQLIKVDEELKQELKFEYVLVVDTEGLRAVELSKKNSVNHDNELATFVIGLGNITVINIFGENPSEMQDILQIAVQAFLRMKQVNLRPSCLFVHQNVGEITAKEKNMEGRRRLQEKLDEMTLCAAQQEQCDVTCFNDVIQFDVNTHIHYFAHLWEGDPPMAPPNPSYSENVQELKKIILQSGKQEERANILSISMFKARVNDLWNALLNENFVFSFKNSLEIAAYNKLETKYSQLAWSLREHMLTLQNKINNQIHNDVIKSVNVVSLTKEFEPKYKTIQEDLNKFFTEEKDCEMLVQWRANTEIRLSTLKSDIIEEMKKKTDELLTAKNNSAKMNIFKEKYEDEMFEKSKKLALTLKGRNLNDEELQEKFNDMWNALITEVTNTINMPERPEIHLDLENVFLERFKTETNLVDTIRDSYNWKDFLAVFSKYIEGKRGFFSKVFSSGTLSHDDQDKIKHTTYALEKRVNEYIEKKEQEIMDYQCIYFHEILNTINKEIYTMLDKKFKFLTEYKLYVSLFLSQIAARRFVRISDAFREANNPLVYLEGKRDQFWQSFKISCKESKETASLAELLCNTLKGSIQQEVTEKAALELAGDMKCNDPSLNGNRSKLDYCLLKSLAEKERFQDYINYIKDPKSAVQDFIKERVHVNCSNKTKISDIFNIKVDLFRQLVSKAIDKSTAEVTDKRGNVKSWLESFCQGLQNEMKLSSNDLKSIQYQNITDIGFLREAMTKALQIVVKNLKDELSACDLQTLKQKTFTILFDQFPGCWKKCPFCHAICTHTTSTHDGCHSMKYHRPSGLRGEKWHCTNHFATDICTTVVSSNIWYIEDDNESIRFPYKNYKTAGPPYSEWSITPDNSALSYWKWVTCRFKSDFEKYYNLKFQGRGEIPSQWRNITKQDAIREIENMM